MGDDEVKSWPKDKTKTVPFSELVESIRAALKFAYRFERINIKRTIPWKGYDIGERDKVCCFSPDEALQKINLAFDLEDQGRDALDVIIGIAIQMGIEQGRRYHAERIDSSLTLLRIHLDGARSCFEKLPLSETVT